MSTELSLVLITYRLTKNITVWNMLLWNVAFDVKLPSGCYRVSENICLSFNFKLNDWFMLFYWLLTVIGFNRPPYNHLYPRFIAFLTKNKWIVITRGGFCINARFSNIFAPSIVHVGRTADLFSTSPSVQCPE